MAARRDSLTDKQQIFVKEYLIDRNGKRAAIAAGYAPKSAEVAASKLLRTAKVSAEVGKATQKLLNKLEISAERVLQEIARLAFYDPRKFFNADGSLKQVVELDDDTAMALGGMDVDDLFEGRGESRERVGYSRKFKLADKGANLERLGKHLRLFTDKVEHSGPEGGPIEVNDARARLLATLGR